MDTWGEQRPLYEVKANLFKGLSHPVRVRVLEVLSAQPETSVAELLADTGLEASHLSQHLSVLRSIIWSLQSAEGASFSTGSRTLRWSICSVRPGRC